MQTLPSEVDGPKWQRDWGLIGSNPGVRLAPFWTTRLGLFLLFFHILLIFLQSTMITFQLGLRPQQRDSLIDSQMFVLKVFYLSHIFVMDVRFLADICFLTGRCFFLWSVRSFDKFANNHKGNLIYIECSKDGDTNIHPSDLNGEVSHRIESRSALSNNSCFVKKTKNFRNIS